ncbi:MAG: hypothetical protein JW973_07325 [Bacteroidales bacterium]|nr:hypothetical protein [Bacteroidales bacterium]
MLYILLIFVFLQPPPDLIRILEATRQEWTGGREETGKGVNYEIKLVVDKKSTKLKFVSVTVDQQGCSYKVNNISDPERGNRYRKGDTLMISALLKNPPEYPPKKLKPYPVIGCSFKNKIYYFPVRQGIDATPGKYK